MDISVVVGLSGAAGAVVASVISGGIQLWSTSQSKKIKLQQVKLKTLYVDGIAFIRLEQAYAQALAEHRPERTPEAIRKEFRKTLREEGVAAISSKATELEYRRELDKMVG